MIKKLKRYARVFDFEDGQLLLTKFYSNDPDHAVTPWAINATIGYEDENATPKDFFDHEPQFVTHFKTRLERDAAFENMSYKEATELCCELSKIVNLLLEQQDKGYETPKKNCRQIKFNQN